MLSPVVRPATLKDLPWMVAVLDQPYFRAYGLTPEGARRLLERALREGEVYGVGEPLQALAWYCPKGGFGQGYLRLLAVAEGAQGQGLGTALMGFLLPRGLRFVLAEKENTKALAFYGRFGFQVAGELPGFVRPERTEVILWRP